MLPNLPQNHPILWRFYQFSAPFVTASLTLIIMPFSEIISFQCASLFLSALYFQSNICLEVSMCGRFAQVQTREEYLAYLADEADHEIA